MDTAALDHIIRLALEEDAPEGDITSAALVPTDARSEAVITAKEDGVMAGMPAARRVFELVDPDIALNAFIDEGADFENGQALAMVRGRTASILTGERVALNFLQRLCGVATLTRRYVAAVAGTKAKILDTRKTTPGLRFLEKYAVRMGGGANHRMSLSDMVLIKDNHLAFIGRIADAVRLARQKAPQGKRIEVEVKDLDELKEALEAGADMVMLDNMTPAMIKKAVEMTAGRVPLEASGNIRLETVHLVAETGVDFISVGALTHSFKAVDISLEF
jgi:nicotinate-nucleotide pyrophosphorylase (carboxylating)